MGNGAHGGRVDVLGLFIKIFEQQKVDILVGTQMVVKGLDFEHVNLVGITDADALLSFVGRLRVDVCQHGDYNDGHFG